MPSFAKNAVFLRRFLSLKRDSTPEGFVPIYDSCPADATSDDVFIAGYPKSGNTWFQNLVSGVIYGVNPKWSPPSLANDLVPDVHFNGFFRRYSMPMYFKTHSLPRPAYRRVVYLLRDGRDAMVSYLHYLEALERRKLDFMGLVTNGLSLTSGKWHEHVDAWAENPYGAEILTIKYEDLVSEPVTQLERFCEFASVSRERAHLETVADAARFQNLRAKEARVGWGWPNRWPTNKFFFRRGVPGSHKDEMPKAVLAAFLGEAAPTLRRNGYAVSEPAEIAGRARFDGGAREPQLAGGRLASR